MANKTNFRTGAAIEGMSKTDRNLKEGRSGVGGESKESKLTRNTSQQTKT